MVRVIWDEIIKATPESDRKYLDRCLVPKAGGVETALARKEFLEKSAEVVADASFTIYAYRHEALIAKNDRIGKVTKKCELEPKGTLATLLTIINKTKDYDPDYNNQL
mmetsp:Transcript_24290/g.36929  ORF Transcript_24290/g.36929 Transcript_24290/m.36929 type:complete len:108 (+) Transcript_24290:838-1161(+)